MIAHRPTPERRPLNERVVRDATKHGPIEGAHRRSAASGTKNGAVSQTADYDRTVIRRRQNLEEHQGLRRCIEESFGRAKLPIAYALARFGVPWCCSPAFAFQACAFNHSAISPFSINNLRTRRNPNAELCQTLQSAAIAYDHFKYSRQSRRGSVNVARRRSRGECQRSSEIVDLRKARHNTRLYMTGDSERESILSKLWDAEP